MSKITIAIDGYSSCGKSTLARTLAHKLGYTYVDSGAMYRAVTLYCLRNGIIRADGSFDQAEVIRNLDNIHISFRYNPSTWAPDTLLNSENVEKEIRQMDVSSSVSAISAIKEVREKLLSIQRSLGKNKGVVMDGRDIGTNVLPDADLKIFMTADTDVRAQRRHDELTSKGVAISFDEVKENLTRRDREDESRKESPLRKAKDAIILDNTDLNKEQQLDYVLRLIDDLLLTKD